MFFVFGRNIIQKKLTTYINNYKTKCCILLYNKSFKNLLYITISKIMMINENTKNIEEDFVNNK